MSSFKTKRISKNSYSEQSKPLQKEDFVLNDEKEIQHNAPISPKKPKNAFRRFVGILLVLSSILFLSILGIKAASQYGLSDKIEEIKAFNPIISALGGQKIVGQENEQWIKNILIAGIGGRDHDGGELTDSLILASLNYDKKTVTLLSIPRDLYVAYPKGLKQVAGKINALYPIGQSANEGINYLAQKVSEMTGQPIHHYAVIDFSGFRSIVNALGGVEVDVPNDIHDTRYPTYDWKYETFKLSKWLQTLDGETALKFARSRHSSSDYDRSNRQQLLIKAIKDKALSLGVLTNPAKISNLVGSIRENLSTDLTIGDIVDIGLNFKEIDNKNIVMYSINNECTDTVCPIGGYLYQPPMDMFGGAWVVIPQGGSRSRLSSYDQIRQYVNTVFQYPHIKDESPSINIITSSRNIAAAREVRSGLQKIGFPLDDKTPITQTGGTFEKTRILSYWDSTTGSGFNDDHILIKGLKFIEPSIAIEKVNRNEFIQDRWPRIEIIIGDDIKNLFKFSLPLNEASNETDMSIGSNNDSE